MGQKRRPRRDCFPGTRPRVPGNVHESPGGVAAPRPSKNRSCVCQAAGHLVTLLVLRRTRGRNHDRDLGALPPGVVRRPRGLLAGSCQLVSHRLIHRDTCPVGGRLSRLPREAGRCRQAAGHRVGPGSVGGVRGGHLGGGARIILTGARRALRGRQIVIGQPGQRPCSAAGAARKPDAGRPEETHEKTVCGLGRVSSCPPGGQNGAEARKNMTWSPRDR